MSASSENYLKIPTEAQELKHNYDLREVLGSGTSSIVYRALHKRTGKEFAVKIVDLVGELGGTMEEQVKIETLREISILKLCIGQEHIIQLYEYFQTPTTFFLVVELCKQGELFDYLTQMISLTERRVRILMRQVFEAVMYIHSRNIVHRDLKPENILLDDNFTIKISDFGFGVILEEDQTLSDLCGTPAYLAPEVLIRSMYEDAPGYGKEVDMWACGVIMFTLMCGAPPFWNRRQMVMLRSIMNGDFSFNNPEWNDITPDAKNLIKQLLMVDPKMRMTAEDALEHPFFYSEDGLMFRRILRHPLDIIIDDDRRRLLNKFRIAVYCIMFINCYYRPSESPVLDVELFQNDPYSIKTVRRSIDAAAFCMYRHWVKKKSQQNRAALFEHELRYPKLNDLASLSSLSNGS